MWPWGKLLEQTSITIADAGAARLGALLRACGEARDVSQHDLMCAFRRLTRDWGEVSVGEAGGYRTNIADDGAPFEFCIALSNGPPEVQFYVEPQAPRPSLARNMQLTQALLATVGSEDNLCLERFRALQEEFLPADPCGPFALWLGVSWAAGRGLQTKAYFSPQVQGVEGATVLVDRAMSLLGHAEAWALLRTRLVEIGRPRDELAILSLDLGASPDARVKVYLRHEQANIHELDALVSIVPDYRNEDVETFYRALGASDVRFTAKPPITEFAFVSPDQSQPASATLEYPIGSYVESDEEARARVLDCLAAFGLPTRDYERAIRAFATRSLEADRGIHAHVTLRRLRDGRPRIAVYFASEVYRTAFVRGREAVEFSPQAKGPN
jgi:DMATS type aromatic prenyltransferase